VSSMPESDVRAALGALELFQGSASAAIDRLAALARPISLDDGQYLFREGDPGDSISLLASGGLEALTRLPGGRELEIEPVGPGVLIGEMAVLAARNRRWSARATEPSAGWSFEAAEVGRLEVANQPEVVRRLGRVALGRLREQYARLARLCVGDPRMDEEPRPAELDDAGPVKAVEREPEETSYLETVLFFSRFTAPELDEMFGDLRRLEAPRGATVLAAGEPASALLVVLRGAVETSIRRGGLAARARLAGPGRVVGHLSLDGGQPAYVASRARERSILLEVPLERVAQIIDRADDTARRFGRAVYADVVDALFEAQRPIARMAAAGG
jgi:CRP-like cAMP-binding protein